METLRIKFNDAVAFDDIVHGRDGARTFQDGGDLQIVTKDNATDEGRAIAVITFSIDVDGKPARAQTVVTVRLLTALLAGLQGRYGYEGTTR